jgi:hypothetical protein
MVSGDALSGDIPTLVKFTGQEEFVENHHISKTINLELKKGP